MCIGRNYVDHAKELGNDVPSEPLIFLKPPSSLIGDGDYIELPPQSAQVEHECEIGVVAGSRLRNASEAEAVAGIKGIVPLNDVTARDLQRKDGQWTRAKGFDTFCPVGRMYEGMVDLGALEVETRVNGVVRQKARSADMVFPISAQTAFQGAAAVAYGAGSLTRKVLSPFKPVLNNPLTRSTGSRYNSLVLRGEQEIGGMVRLGQIEEQRSRQMAQDIFNGVVGQVIQNLSDNPQITVLIQTQVNELARSDEDIPQFDELVSKLAGNYLAYLQEHPEELSGLVRQAGDNYIDYLNENPEQVQDLIQGQSLTLTAEILDEVRERMVTGDSLLEMLARTLFRRSPRPELPGPPPEVRARAGVSRLPRDFKRLERINDE